MSSVLYIVFLILKFMCVCVLSQSITDNYLKKKRFCNASKIFYLFERNLKFSDSIFILHSWMGFMILLFSSECSLIIWFIKWVCIQFNSLRPLSLKVFWCE